MPTIQVVYGDGMGTGHYAGPLMVSVFCRLETDSEKAMSASEEPNLAPVQFDFEWVYALASMKEYGEPWRVLHGKILGKVRNLPVRLLLIDADGLEEGRNELTEILVLAARHRVKTLVIRLAADLEAMEITAHSYAGLLADRLDKARWNALGILRYLKGEEVTELPLERIVLWHPRDISQVPCPEDSDAPYDRVLGQALNAEFIDVVDARGQRYQALHS